MFIFFVLPPLGTKKHQDKGNTLLSQSLAYCRGKDKNTYDNQQNGVLLLGVLFTTSKEVSFVLRTVQQTSDVGAVGVEEQQRHESHKDHQSRVAVAT